ncbi:GntR family transcriptional regulator [Defluviitalea raffinosedens]|jgi:GntR family transcriptional regulator|uniref:GntR family transcriptional regulator n=1 Tax=Defluviitalea raffinosedens TaxID=1450156 RepID=A0A7C8HEI5_9FIRM|nr:GntR family transcriptional regulator [Defluviitalea raffinosedens]KAE9634090.1 GntR family transcriptional regulator [Defluviitalea raffinosedens]MBM7686793.1 GntR family transcriptional regulator [Defluviitalea raffinosedens]HHW68034.1 GntR family transcriptional regulator [Candidatus Epulonipiscium sp.]
MNIIISNSSNQPIYEQIVSQIKALIISGELNEGDALPSMRLLAKELRISVITTKRAYEELEKEGFIVSITGKGSFVASKNLELIKEQQLKEIENHMQEIIDLANLYGISLEELIEMLTLMYKGE